MFSFAWKDRAAADDEPPPRFTAPRAAPGAGMRPRSGAAPRFEQRAVKFFSERGAQCAAGSPEQELYKELAAEEREHVDLLTTEFARYRQGKPGLL